MLGMRWFRSLQWSLTLNYTLVTTAASAVLLFPLFAVIGRIIFRSDELPRTQAAVLAWREGVVRRE